MKKYKINDTFKTLIIPLNTPVHTYMVFEDSLLGLRDIGILMARRAIPMIAGV